jgi:hypothetical protein
VISRAMTTAQLELTGSKKKSDVSDLIDGLSKTLHTNNEERYNIVHRWIQDTEYNG